MKMIIVLLIKKYFFLYNKINNLKNEKKHEIETKKIFLLNKKDYQNKFKPFLFNFGVIINLCTEVREVFESFLLFIMSREWSKLSRQTSKFYNE